MSTSESTCPAVSAEDRFRIITGSLVMFVNDLRLEKSLFLPPKPSAWMLQYYELENFSSIIRHIIGRKLNVTHRNLPIENLNSIFSSISLQDFLEYSSPTSTQAVTSSSSDQSTKQDSPVKRVSPRTKINSHQFIEMGRENLVIADSDPKTVSVKMTVRPINYAELKNDNSVYELSNKYSGSIPVCRKLLTFNTDFHASCGTVDRGSRFDILIYAPPHSGKTTFINSGLDVKMFGINFGSSTLVMDTDNMFQWMNVTSRVTLTNMSHLLKQARYSIAIVPKEETFLKRCKMRGLDPQSDWYSGMLLQSSICDVVLYTDHYVLEAMQLITCNQAQQSC